MHRLDPRTKLSSFFVLMLFILFIHNLYSLLIFMAFIAGVCIFARLPLRLLLVNIRPFWFLFLITFFLQAFLAPSSTPTGNFWNNIHFSVQGVESGLFYVARIVLLLSAASLLTLTTSPMSLTDAMEKILKPFKNIGIHAHEIAMMISISMRFIPILLDEALRIQRAQQSRGARFDGNLIQRTRSLIPLLVPLFISAFRRAHHLALAMEARCYRGDEGRTHFEELRFRRQDAVACFFMLFACVPVLFLQ
ncbi:energy-coupling factor transporter transmembrane protein EcfT [bacterium]|nr:energy-coupling factor transporter transmembrane protein EcfT [bacterium]